MKNLPVVTEFTVDRAKWGTGKLLKANGEMCVLGFYMRECGYEDQEILNYCYPAGCVRDGAQVRLGVLPLISKHNSSSELAMKASDINDWTWPYEPREEALTDLFASIGVTVKFE